MRTVHIVPAEGIKVRDPETGAHIPESGATVSLTPYWRRRITEGAVEERIATRAGAATDTKPSRRKAEEK